MNVLKKVVSGILVLGLMFQTGASVFADRDWELGMINFEMKSAKNTIVSEIDWWEKVIERLNTIIWKINDKQARVLRGKVNEKRAMNSNRTISAVLTYILLLLDKRELSQEITDMYEWTITAAEQKEFNTELVKIQKQIVKTWADSFEKLLGEFEKVSNYEEKGNFVAKVNVDHELIGKIKAELKLSDYSIANSAFDTQLKTKVEAMIDAAPKGEKAIKLELAGFVDFILKDQNYYLLLEKFNVTNSEGIDDIKMFIDKVKEVSSKNKYVHFEDKTGAEMMKIVRGFSPESMLSEWNEIAGKPLFKAYKKEGNKYYIIPTKYACDTAKELLNKFDPFNGSSCTQGQYEDMLADIADSKMSFYMELGANTVLWFEWWEVAEIESVEWSIAFSDTAVEKLHFMVKPDQIDNPWEGASVDYVRKNSLSAHLNAEKGKVHADLNSSLDKNNRFTAIDLSAKIEELSGELTLKNKMISGKYGVNDGDFKIVGMISWKTSWENKLVELHIKNEVIDDKNDNISVFDYNNGAFSFVNDYVWEGTQFHILIDGKRNAQNNTFTSGHLVAWMKTKQWEFDYDTYEMKYSGDFQDIFSTDIALENKKIVWKTIVNVEGAEYLKITHTGGYEKDYFSLQNNIALSETASKMFMMGIGAWLWEEAAAQSIEWNINFTVDARENNNNINILLDVLMDTKEVIKLEVDNKSQIEYKEVNIQAPSKDKIIPVEEIIENPLY